MADGELTIAELLAGNSGGGSGSGGVGSINDVIASTIARVGSGSQQTDDPLLGGVSEGFSTGEVTVPGIRGDQVPAFRQDKFSPGTEAIFREKDLERIAAWPIEKRARLILQMQKSGIVSPDVSARRWDPDAIEEPLKKALTFANFNGITDPFEAVGMYGTAKAEFDQKARPTFNFVERDFLPPDPESVDQDIRKLAKDMFAGTDIELSDEEVATLRGQFEGLLKEQHFAQEQQRLGEEKTSFDAQVASSEGRTFEGSVPAVPQVDAGARFRNVFEERYQPELNAIEKMGEDNVQREATGNTLSRVLQFATGRQ